MWQHWVTFILGILVAVFAYSGTGGTLMAVFGIFIIIFSLWGALSKA